ncbi:MAG: hypothetical protein M0R51_13275 [Clostridia bacterium]|jgi:hypothetical protein|nr:hypothetical protein [Clostridia bacterium]
MISELLKTKITKAEEGGFIVFKTGVGAISVKNNSKWSQSMDEAQRIYPASCVIYVSGECLNYKTNRREWAVMYRPFKK